MNRFIRRSYSREVIDDIVHDFMDKKYKMKDLSEKYEIDYTDLRYILRQELGGTMLLRIRKRYRREKYGVEKTKIGQAKTIPIVVDLLVDKELSYADIARKHNVSRERVGQVAERVGKCGQDVARHSLATRGKAA
jgi:hypothetical protein